MAIQIPEQIKSFNFVLLREGEKKPFEKGWTKIVHRLNDSIFQNHIQLNKPYGVQSNNSSVIINGKSYFLIQIDFDKREFQDEVISKFPETFTTSSNSPKNTCHIWLASDNNKAFKIFDEKQDTLCDVIGEGNQVVAPGSKHPSGSIYSVIKDMPIAFMPYAEIEAILKPYDKKPKRITKIKKQYSPNGITLNQANEIINAVSMETCLQEVGIDTSKNPTNCFAHSSNGGKCFSFNDDTAHCFHCLGSWNRYSLIRESKNLTDKECFEWFAKKGNNEDKLKKQRKEFVEKSPKINSFEIFGRRGQIESFWQQQPFFYDKSKIFWLWNKEERKWMMSDEVDFLNLIQETLGIETIDSQTKTELISGFQQIGRRHQPKPIKKNWVQFKDKLYDVLTEESFEATPQYFATNPIPWKVGTNEETPTIDKYFSEWVGEEYKKTLYEIIAYNISQNKFMQRIIALCGGGSNGKGTFIKLNYRFIGEDNCVSSEVKDLSENHFEPAVLYRKLLCVMGEVSYDDLRNTNMLKKLGGEDKISFQFKGRTPFTADNTASCICLTNSMPLTPDKSMGFYRKWLIIDFPNQFKQIKENIINQIPDVEFENLARKSLRILKELYKEPSFTNEGDFDERTKRYEERSNPVMKFIEIECEEQPGENLTLRDFTNECNNYLKSNHLRILTAKQIGKILREEGFSVCARKVEDVSSIVILNLKLSKLSKLSKSKIEITHRKQFENTMVLDSFDGNLEPPPQFPVEKPGESL